ncbi:class I SAM-dependent methyltransferase [Mycobacterium sp. SMC-2]|uniref:class I SAM-dependent methyltransferase n=1 Tax=Mycobacterium sp. SMC-2 TaxID=2857058 RepID=UPI0021B34A88|nr:class I SAM-dependent methyltransferase [Mycobacterium sp. SMC-2]UXA04219.1 class I SAM-dependent methyltransferase [Mycobacterium sp. SMC-2]
MLKTIAILEFRFRRQTVAICPWTPSTSAEAPRTVQKFTKLCLSLIDFALLPITATASLALRVIRSTGFGRMPLALRVFRRIGIFPILDHYYEPLFNPVHLRKPLSEDRELPSIDWNVTEQLDLLRRFRFNDELVRFPLDRQADHEFFYRNGFFESGDAEFLYNMIRLFKPKRIFEIGSGQSTLLAASAVEANRVEDSGYKCEHVCIEPYEADWLDRFNVSVVRKPVELIDTSLFRQLEKDDILFIDSSHMIRPQGDVLFEYFEILPILKSGVLIHIHDIFTPKDYLEEWVQSVCFWNEQYLLEAFLSYNSEFKVIGALNFLRHHYTDELTETCPVLRQQLEFREPGSFWLRRV